MRGPNRRAQKCGAQNRGGPLTHAALDLSPHAGRGAKNPFSRRIRARAMPRHSRKPSLRGVKRRSNPAGQCTLASLSNETALPNWIASAARARNDEGKLMKEKKEAERRQTCDPTVRILRCGARPNSLPPLAGGRERARSPVGVPPRRLLRRPNATAQLQIRASWDLVGAHDPKGSNNRVRKIVRCLSGRYPLLPVPVQRASRRPVIVPAGRISPEPPGSGGDEPPPAGTALAPPAGVTGWRPLRERDSLNPVSEIATFVNENVPRYSPESQRRDFAMSPNRANRCH